MKNKAQLRPAASGALAAALLLSATLCVSLAAPAAAAPEIRVEPLGLDMNEPQDRDIYIEIDWMESAGHSHRPSTAVLDRIEAVFAAAGYTAHLELSSAIPHQDLLAVTNRPSSSPEVAALMNRHFDHAGDSRWFYSLWAHNYSFNGAFSSSSGIADLPGRVHLVTLGSFANQVGSFANQVGTLIHELGHNIGQRHGGSDDENWKPNYLSVMNYYYQLQGIGPALLSLRLASSTTGIEDFGYSHGLLPPLNENALDERAGIGLGRAVDWDCDGVIESQVAKDVQGSNWCSAANGRTSLADFDNWRDIAGRVAALGEDLGEAGSLTAGEPAAPCVSREEHDRFLAHAERLAAEAAARGEAPFDLAAALESSEAAVTEPSPFAGASSFTITNDGASDLQIGSLALDAAAPYIRWSPAAPLTLAPGRSQRIYVTVDWSQVPAGFTQRRLLVASNDGDESPYPGGILLRVQGRGDCVLGTSASPLAGGAASGDTTAPCGSAVTARAVPSAGYSFVRWKDGAATASALPTYTFTLATSRELVAEFAPTSASGTALARGVGRRETLTGGASQGTWKYFYVDVEPGSRHLLALLYDLPQAGPQNLDVYVRLGSPPTLSAWDCRPFAPGGATEECLFATPAPGRWFIGVNNRDLGPISFAVGANWQTSTSEIFADGFELGSTAAWR